MENLPTFVIKSRNGNYIGTVKATSGTDACYTLYDRVANTNQGQGQVLDVDQKAFTQYVMLGKDEGPNFFDNYLVEEVFVSLPYKNATANETGG